MLDRIDDIEDGSNLRRGIPGMATLPGCLQDYRGQRFPMADMFVHCILK